MTNDERYRSELDGVRASSAFKQNTKQWLQAQMEAKEAPDAPAQKPKLKWFTPRRMVAAACVLLVFAGGFMALRGMFMAAGGSMTMDSAASAPAAGQVEAEDAGAPGAAAPEVGAVATLPILALQKPDEGQDWAGLVLNDFDEFGAESPWQAEDAQPQTLPVYTGTQQTADATETQLLAQAQQAADALGLAVTGHEVQKTPEVGTTVVVHADGASIASAARYTKVLFDVAMMPQAGSAPAATAALAAQRQYAQKLVEEYAALFAYMGKPVPEVTLNRTGDGAAHYTYTVYDGSGDLGSVLHSRAFASKIIFGQDAAGGLGIQEIYLAVNDGFVLVEEYPLLTQAEAEELVAGDSGAAMGICGPPAFPGLDAVVAVDMVYGPPYGDLYSIPYYVFYAEIPDAIGLAAGLHEYGQWYVPAVQPEYLQFS